MELFVILTIAAAIITVIGLPIFLIMRDESNHAPRDLVRIESNAYENARHDRQMQQISEAENYRHLRNLSRNDD